jgi:hypothetical protein
MWDLRFWQRCSWRSKFHGTLLYVDWWILNRRPKHRLTLPVDTAWHYRRRVSLCLKYAPSWYVISSEFWDVHTVRVFAFRRHELDLVFVWKQESVVGIVTVVRARQVQEIFLLFNG